ncbi:MAG TPA: hypothetical protein ENH81_03465, partial [Thermococcus sp.]|nr:hypothetical protein [Thermococcus sp.]
MKEGIYNLFHKRELLNNPENIPGGYEKPSEDFYFIVSIFIMVIPMRAFISLDLEGLPYVVSREHLF